MNSILRSSWRWLRSHRWLTAVVLVAVAFTGINIVAYLQARAMMHFVPEGDKTPNPEFLSLAEKAKVLLTGINIPRPANSKSPADWKLPFEVHRFPVDNGGELEGWFIPRDAARGLVLFFHGYSSSKASLLPEAQAFHDLGFATFLIDFRGSGGSSGDDTTVGVREAVDVTAACACAQAKWAKLPIVLYGQSMGSAAILRAVALDGARPRALIVECPFNRLLSTVKHRFELMGLRAFPAAHLLVFWGGVQCGFNGFKHNPEDYARQVQVPTLILHGEKDTRVTPAEVQSIYENLAGEKRLVFFPRAGHQACLAAEPDKWNREVNEFLTARLR